MATENTRAELAQRLLETRREVGEAVTEGITRDPTMRQLPPEKERELFWQRAVTPEQEAQLWAQGVDPWAISAMVYPERWKLAKLGRPTLTQQVRWFKEHQQKGPPAGATENLSGAVGGRAPAPGDEPPGLSGMQAPGQLPSLPSLGGGPPASSLANPATPAGPPAAYPAVDEDAYSGSQGG